MTSCSAGSKSLDQSVPSYFGRRVGCSQSEAVLPFSAGKCECPNVDDVTVTIKAMRDVTSGHLRSSGRTEHLCLDLPGTLWFTRGKLPQVQAMLQLVSSSLSHLFHLLGLSWAVAARAPPLPFGLGITVCRFSRRPP